jgi:hypothetical protein
MTLSVSNRNQQVTSIPCSMHRAFAAWVKLQAASGGGES